MSTPENQVVKEPSAETTETTTRRWTYPAEQVAGTKAWMERVQAEAAARFEKALKGLGDLVNLDRLLR